MESVTHLWTDALPKVASLGSVATGCLPLDVKWVPNSTRLVVVGRSSSQDTGVMQVWDMSTQQHDGPKRGGVGLRMIHSAHKRTAFKCCTFDASPAWERRVAVGDFQGRLSFWDLEHTDVPTWSTRAHDALINGVAGMGGGTAPGGAPELATASRDGSVKVWDPRQKAKPVAATHNEGHDAWCVSLGRRADRLLVAGYDNGNLRLMDLRSGCVQWNHCPGGGDGIVALDFDRSTSSPSYRVVAGTTGSQLHVLDMEELADVRHDARVTSHTLGETHGTTVWSVRHHPTRRRLFATTDGVGSVRLHAHSEPGDSVVVQSLLETRIASSTMASFDWHPDHESLWASIDFQGNLHIGVVAFPGSAPQPPPDPDVSKPSQRPRDDV